MADIPYGRLDALAAALGGWAAIEAAYAAGTPLVGPGSGGGSGGGNPEIVNAVAASGSAQTIPDVGTATISRLTLSANCALTFPTAAAGKSFTVILVQDGTGSRTVTWPGAVIWAGGPAPTLTTTPAKRDVFSFLCDDGSAWLGFVGGQSF